MRLHLRMAITVVATAASLVVPGHAQAATTNRIDHVVVLMLENRSTDDYFAHLHDVLPSFEAEPRGASNPDPVHRGRKVTAFHQTSYCESADLDHSWEGAHREYDNGKMDGFALRNQDPSDPSGRRAMGYYTRADLPYYYGLYSTFATSDRYFSSVLGPTYPNRFFSYAATSWGMTSNITPTSPTDFPGRSILNVLDEKNISWRVYYTEVPFVLELAYARDHAAGHLFPMSQYYADAAAGTLPQVSFLDPGYFGTRNTESDEHPPANVQTGQLLTSKLVGALLGSPAWSSSAMFITYDEDGGYYDHVAPPAAPVPDGQRPQGESGRFDRYGFRVPMVAISPYARPHYVSHVVQDHTSILKFIETRFHLPSLTKRDAHADAMLGLFDFSHPAFAKPPTLPSADVESSHAVACQVSDVSSSAPSTSP